MRRMAAALAELVVKKLGSLAADQAGALWGIESEFLKLQSTVSTIQAVLLDAEDQSSRSHQVQQWLQELKEVLYDAEDLVYDFSTEALRMRGTDCSLIKNVVYELKVANQIKAIRSKLVDIDENRKQFDFQTRQVEPSKEWRQTHSSVPELVVGREGDKQRVIDMLLLSSYRDKVAVIPIVGIGGLGKTTLAQQVYNDDRIESRFECKYWVCVSETFEPKLLVKNVLESITKEKVDDLAFNTLKDLLHERIRSKRLLLVLDDVWNEDIEKWVHFKSLISSGAAEGSRIIITTRLGIVGEMTATETIVCHELQGLSEPESWCLFEKVAFKGGVASSCPRYVEIGKNILRECGGVPLAIRTMGGLLYFKDSESEWEAVREKQMLSLDLSGPDSEILASTLRLSYDNLPSNLKRCFAYCALFPKDHKFSIRMLIQLWVAQGYVIIKSSQSSPHEDVGVEHFKNMLWRSFFQELTKDAWGNMQSCKMHDLMHDLAVTVAREDTITLNRLNLTGSFLSSSVSLERIRHLSIDFENRFAKETWQVPALLAKATKLRTFLVINVPYKSFKMEGECEMIFSKMTRLRVLRLKNTGLQIVQSTIQKLKLCRYLDLSGNEMQTLPDEIATLVNLQVLNLCWCENLLQLPGDIRKLSNLMYLDLNGCWGLTFMPAGIAKLCHLRELSLIVASGDSRAAGLGEMNLLNNLSGKLCIRGLQWVKDKSEAEAANLKEKSKLRRLELRWGTGSSTSSSRANHERSILEALQPHSNLKEIELWSYGGMSLPASWFSSLRNVLRMQLTRSKKLQCLPPLVPFVSLEELQLTGLDSLEYVQKRKVSPSPPSPNGLQLLPSLKSLEIWNCPNLIGWWLPMNNDLPQLPWVSKLVIRGCPKMVSMPRFSAQLKDVELVDVQGELLAELVHARLNSLTIRRVKDLRVLPQLTYVDNLRVFDCPNLTVLSPAMFQLLPSLQKLVIYNCRALELEDNDTTMPPCVIPSLLRILDVSKVDKFEMLPEWLQHCLNLQQLVIRSCDNFKGLPSWLTKLTALESLVIKDCHLLSERCRSSTGEDWANISHVSNITVNGTMIQKHGRYLVLDEEAEAEAKEEEEEAEEELEASLHPQFSRILAFCIGWLTCNLFQRCFLP